MNKVVGIIPARFKSSRFPGKPLVAIAGKQMILHVAEIAAAALGEDNVYIATDDQRIRSVVESAGFQVLMTSETAKTGTDRLWEAAKQVRADCYINIQGDEPLIDPEDIRKIADEKCRRIHGVVNGMCYLSANEDPTNPNIPKVAASEDGKLIYMSRLPVPGFKSPENQPDRYLKQVCIYAFTYDELRIFGEFGRKTYLEDKEDIEILRFLDLSVPIYMVHTSQASLAVDVPEDVARVEAALELGNFNRPVNLSAAESHHVS